MLLSLGSTTVGVRVGVGVMVGVEVMVGVRVNGEGGNGVLVDMTRIVSVGEVDAGISVIKVRDPAGD